MNRHAPDRWCRVEALTALAQISDDDRAHPERVVYLLFLLPILFVIGLVIGLGLGVRDEDLIELILALVTTVLALVPLVLDQGRRPSERYVLLSTFSIVFIIGFVLPVLVIFIPAEGPIDAPSYSWSFVFPVDIIRGQVATILGLLCLLAGHAIPIDRFARFVPKFRTDWPPMATLAVAMLMIPFGFMVRAANIAGVLSAEIGTGILSVLSSSSVYGIALAAIAYTRHRSPLAVAILVVVVPIMSFLGLFTGSKSAVLMPWVMVALSIILVRRRLAARWVVLGVLGVTLVYPVNTFVRNDILVYNTLSPATAMRNPSATLGRISRFMSGSEPATYFQQGLLATVGRMDCIGAASVLIRDTPSRVDFQNGRTIWLFFYAFVPRAIWKDKPIISIGQFFTDEYGSGPRSSRAPRRRSSASSSSTSATPASSAACCSTASCCACSTRCCWPGRPTTPGLLAAVVVLLYMSTGFQGSIANNWGIMVISILPIPVAHAIVTMLFPARGSPAAFEAHGGHTVAD
jgi:hypothetical protein